MMEEVFGKADVVLGYAGEGRPVLLCGEASSRNKHMRSRQKSGDTTPHRKENAKKSCSVLRDFTHEVPDMLDRIYSYNAYYFLCT